MLSVQSGRAKTGLTRESGAVVKKDVVRDLGENKNIRKGDVSDVIMIYHQLGALCLLTLYLHWCQLDGGDVGGVHHRFWAIGSVRQQALPLLRQPGELLLSRIKACVDPVLKVRRSGDLQPFLLLPKHAGKPLETWQTKKRGLCINIYF